MQPTLSLACFLSVIRPPGIQFEDALLQSLPVDKAKCPFVRDRNDIGFRLFTRHNPTVYQELRIDDDEALFASNFDFHDPTVFYFSAFMEQPDDGSGLMVRQSYMLRGRTNFIILDISRLEAGPWYFTAAENTWYIGNFAARFIDYMVTRGMDLNTTHLVGHSLGGQSAGVAGYAIQSGKVSRITGLDPALPLFAHLPLSQRLDPSDGQFVDIIHTDAGIFGYKAPIGHADFYPNGGISPQPGCELEIVLHEQRFLNKCGSDKLHDFYVYHLTPAKKQHTLVYKLLELFTYINSLSDGDMEPTSPDTDVHFEENIDKKQDTDTNLDELGRNKLDEQIDEEKNNDIAKKSILLDKLYKANRKIDSKPVKIAQPSENTGIAILDKDELNNKDEELKLTDDSIAIESEAVYKREKRTNKDNTTSSKTEEEININSEEDIKDTTSVKDIGNRTDENKDTLHDTKLHTANPTVQTPKDEETKSLLDDKLKPKSTPQTTLAKNAKVLINNPIPRIVTNILFNKLTNHNRKQTKTDDTKSQTSKRHSAKLFNKQPKLHNAKLQRQKRFISLFRNNEDNDSFLFKILEFLMKNRKNVIPVVTVMREINTLVKSASGELNHVSKERNNYIGALPTLTPIKFDLELGESGIVSFIKRLFGLAPRGGKLSITET